MAAGVQAGPSLVLAGKMLASFPGLETVRVPRAGPSLVHALHAEAACTWTVNENLEH